MQLDVGNSHPFMLHWEWIRSRSLQGGPGLHQAWVGEGVAAVHHINPNAVTNPT